jgi:hypothetical protein
MDCSGDERRTANGEDWFAAVNCHTRSYNNHNEFARPEIVASWLFLKNISPSARS